MIEEIPNINELIETYKDHPEWIVLQSVFNELYNILIKCLAELGPFLVQEKNFLPDDKYYILLYLFRTKRIFISIILLLIYERYAEARILQRPFLENIVDTKMFLQSGTRLSNKRKIQLYNLLNEKRRYELYMEDYKRSKKEHGVIITSVATQNINERLEKKINEGLKKFDENQIKRMDKKISSGTSWHGCKTKEAFKRSGMIDDYEDYNKSCEFLHVRDWPLPVGLLPHEDMKIGIQFEFNKIMRLLVNHLEDFVLYCPNTFSRKLIKMKELKEKLNNQIENIFKNTKEFPDLSEIIMLQDE
jgi:hypothetical protein